QANHALCDVAANLGKSWTCHRIQCSAMGTKEGPAVRAPSANFACGARAAAPPRSVTNSRRFIGGPPTTPPSVGLLHVQPTAERLLVLGPDLNCSESRCCSPTATTN